MQFHMRGSSVVPNISTACHAVRIHAGIPSAPGRREGGGGQALSQTQSMNLQGAQQYSAFLNRAVQQDLKTDFIPGRLT